MWPTQRQFREFQTTQGMCNEMSAIDIHSVKDGRHVIDESREVISRRWTIRRRLTATRETDNPKTIDEFCRQFIERIGWRT
jgi:hypothetical protein